MPLTKNVKWMRSPPRFSSAAKSVSSCQRSSSVQLSKAITMNCGGRSTPACAGICASSSKPSAAMIARAVNPAPQLLMTANQIVPERRVGLIDGRGIDLAARVEFARL